MRFPEVKQKQKSILQIRLTPQHHLAPQRMKPTHGTWTSTSQWQPLDSAALAAQLLLPVKRTSAPRLLAGRREWLAFPQLGIPFLIAKSDTGARTSTLHAEDISYDSKTQIAHFTTRDAQGNPIFCTCHAEKHKAIRSSSGHTHNRIIIRATAQFPSGFQLLTEFTLADRSQMKCPILLGRRAFSGYFTIDPQAEFLLGTPS